MKRCAEIGLSVAAATLAMALLACGGDARVAAADTDTPVALEAQSPAAAAADIPLISHAAVVGENLLFGGPPTEVAVGMLADIGFASVLTVLGEDYLPYDERAAVEAAGMTFIRIPMALPPEEITDEMVDAFDTAMREAPRPILLHCVRGNLVAGLYAVWLAERDGVPPEDAVERGVAAGMTLLRPVVEARLGLAGSS